MAKSIFDKKTGKKIQKITANWFVLQIFPIFASWWFKAKQIFNTIFATQCGMNIIFLDKWISEYILYHRYWRNEYPNIFGMVKRSQMNIRINTPQKKSTNIFANEYIHAKYSNIFEYQIICPRLFWTILCYFGPISNHFGPIITICNHFWETIRIQIYLLS